MPRDLDEKRGAWVRRVVRAGIVAAGLGATSLSGLGAGVARADSQVFADAGFFIGYHWGEGGGFTWGLEGRVGSFLTEQSGCNADTSWSGAAVLRAAFVDWEHPRLTLGGQLAGWLGPIALAGDVGFGYRWGEPHGLSIPVGLDLQVYAVDAFVQADTNLGGGLVAAGFRYPPPDRQLGCAVVGRALHDEQGRAPLPSISALGPMSLESELDQAVADEYGARARGEWASVPAFFQLADQLARAGAPPSLVARALGSARDELRHAVISARVAVLLGGAPVRLGRVTPATRAAASGPDALRRLAIESWIDGCLGEGKASAAAAREAAAATDGALRTVQGTIARDEGRHADLAWDVLAWALAAGGDEIRHAVWAARDGEPTDPSGDESGLDLSAQGLLSKDDHERIGDELAATARTRLAALLG